MGRRWTGWRAGLYGLMLAAALSGPAVAQQDPDPTASPNASADPNAAQPRPLKFTLAYTADLLGNLRGGIHTGFRALDKTGARLELDAKSWGRPGLTGALEVQHVNGASFSGQLVGDIETVSNLEAPEAFRLYEAWLGQSFLDDSLGIKLGQVDLNADFDVQETARVFIDSSHGIAPDFSKTGLNGPSIFLQPGLAVTGWWKPAGGWTVRAGAFDGVPGDPAHLRRTAYKLSAREGALLVAQAERRLGKRARIEVGTWSYTARLPALNARSANGQPVDLGGDRGAYGLVEGRLLQGRRENTGLSSWIRLGVGEGRINRVDGYIGGGLVYSGVGTAKIRSAWPSATSASAGPRARPRLRRAEHLSRLARR